jgi:hypothetical protein
MSAVSTSLGYLVRKCLSLELRTNVSLFCLTAIVESKTIHVWNIIVNMHGIRSLPTPSTNCCKQTDSSAVLLAASDIKYVLSIVTIEKAIVFTRMPIGGNAAVTSGSTSRRGGTTSSSVSKHQKQSSVACSLSSNICRNGKTKMRSNL